MAIEYTLLTSCEQELPSDLLLDDVDLNQIENGCFLRLEGIAIAKGIESELGRKLIEEAYGILVRQIIVFRLDKFELYDAGLDLMVKFVISFVLNSKSDFVFLSNGERALMLKKNGQLAINENEVFWKKRMEELPDGVCYTTESLPSL
jgi:hypothetical protein